MEPNPTLFNDITFYINDSLSPLVQQKLRTLLVDNGAKETASLSISESGKRFDEKDVTHFVTDSLDFPEFGLLRPASGGTGAAAGVANGKGKEDRDGTEVKIVLPVWVTRSFDLQALQHPRYYSADRSLYFSGLCFCTSDLPDADMQAIAAGVDSLGGQYRRELTREVTHLLVVSPSGPKYEMAIQHGVELGMVAVLPHWFEQCLKVGQLVPTDIFRFPSPPYTTTLRTADKTKSFEERLADYWKTSASLHPPRTINARGRSTTADLLEASRVTPSTSTTSILGAQNGQPGPFVDETYHRTALVQLERSSTPHDMRSRDSSSTVGASTTTNGLPVGAPRTTAFPPQINLSETSSPIFAQRRVYLASDLGLRPGLEEALKCRIQEAGGECWSWGVDGVGLQEQGAWERRKEAEKRLKECNTVVMRSREGWEFWHAYTQQKTIGNLSWLYHVLASAKLSSPLDRLLHYPVPSNDGVPEFKDKTITISNYAGAARDYVRAMIETLGGKFDGSMSRSTDFVVTASEYGAKVKHARSWSIPLVSHLWLEACILEWRFVPASNSLAYLLGSTPSTNFTSILGNTSLPRGAIEKWTEGEEVRFAREEAMRAFGEEEGEVVGEEGEGGMEVEEQVAPVNEEEQQMEVDQAEAVVAVDPQPTSSSKGKGKAVASIVEQAKDVDMIDQEQPARAIEDEEAPQEDEDEEDPEPEPSSEPVQSPKKVPIKKLQPTIPAGKAGPGKKKKPVEPSSDSLSSPKTTSSSPPQKRVAKKLKKVVKMVESEDEEEEDVEPEPKAMDQEDDEDDEDEAAVVVSPPKASSSAVKKPIIKPEPKSTPKPLAPAPSRRRRRSSTGSSHSNSSDIPHSSAHAMTKTFGLVDAENIVAAGSRRGAALKGAARLAELMPDANKFALEQRSSGKKKRGGGAGYGARRGSAQRGVSAAKEESESEEEEEGDEKEEPRAVVKRAGKGGKGKKVEKVESEEEEDEEDQEEEAESEDEEPAPKKKKTTVAPAVGPSKKKGRLAQVETQDTKAEVVSSFDNPPRGKPGVPKGKGKILIISTGLSFDGKSPEIKALKPLGATWTESPSQATHLVVKAMSRTEKFLCCLANVPKIVTREWIDESIKKGRLVDETPYLLKDKAKEAELGTTLADILSRAAERKLFEDCTFYITKSVSPSTAVMQKILQSGAATVIIAPNKPTAAIQSKLRASPESFFVVSCIADRHFWEPLRKDKVPVYSVEAVFQSVMKQNMDGFEDKANNRIDPR